jgi:capsular polysaccharide biosynthesis protein
VELREYWAIVRRRWWVVAIVTGVAFVASAAIGLRGAAAYRTDMRIAISTLPSAMPASELYFDPTYYSNLNSEYLADDMSEFMHSEAFASEVRRELATGRDLNVDVNTIINSTRTKKTHRFIDVTVTSATPEDGQEIAGSISRILNDQARLAQYLAALTAYGTSMKVISPPDTHRANTLPGLVSEIALRTLIGLLIGIALAFLLDYLDTSVRSRDEAEDLLRLPVLGTIPRTSKRGMVA